jgi:hypothetical protein
MGYTQLLTTESTGQLTLKQREFAAKILAGATRLQKIIDELELVEPGGKSELPLTHATQDVSEG